MMADKTWKAAERRIAAMLGGKRNGPTGTPQADIDAGWLQVECKHRADLPQWLVNSVQQARQHCQHDQLGVAVLHEAGKPYGRSLVVLRLDDWVDWFGDGQPQEPVALID